MKLLTTKSGPGATGWPPRPPEISSKSRRRGQELRQPIADRRGELALRPLALRFVVAVTGEDQSSVRVGVESGSRFPDLVHHHEVEVLPFELPAAGRLQLPGLGGEAEQDSVSLAIAELLEDVWR